MGNFGTITDPKFAASRYTECKMSEYGNTEFFPKNARDIITTVPNYDNKDKEPLFLPCLVPNLLLNGTQGIAVGVTSNIPPLLMESLYPFLEQSINGKTIDPKKLAKNIRFNWTHGSHCVSDPEHIREWVEEGRRSLLFEPAYELDAKTRTLIITEAPPFFNWDNVVSRIGGNERNGKARYPFVSSIDDMCSFPESEKTSKNKGNETVIRFEVKFKSSIDPSEFATLAKLVMAEFTNSFSTATNVTYRRMGDNKFIKSNLVDLIGRWTRYRVNLEIKMQKHEIALIDKELAHHDLLLKVVAGRDHIRDAWNKTDPVLYVGEKLKIDEEDAKKVLSWNLMSPSNLNKDKILKESAELRKQRKKHKAVVDNPNPTVTSYLSREIR